MFADAEAVVEFWHAAGPSAWFTRNPDFDAEFQGRFLSLHYCAARRECEDWLRQPRPALALILLLDQFPRNAFRDTAHMFATDGLARRYADIALAAGFAAQLPAELAPFLCLPFMHSENLEDQRRSVQWYRQHAQDNLSYADEHLDIIERFGRFPHRNPALGRESTAEELQFLADGGFAG